MASSYTNDLRLEEINTGEQSGTWGDTTNTNLELIAEGFSSGTETIGNADTTITMTDGATDAIRSLYVKISSSADLTQDRTVTIAPSTINKMWVLENNTTGGYKLVISQGTGANVTIPNGGIKIIYTDGAGSGAAVTDALDLTTGTGNIG